MTTFSKSLLAFAVVGALAGIIAFFNFSPFHDAVMSVGGTSASSTNLNTAKFAGIAGINLASAGTAGATGANGTSTSILNPSATDVYVTSIKAGCQGVGTSKTAYTGTGLLALTLSVSTTSTAGPTAVGTNLVAGAALTLGTSTTQFVIASTTAAAPGNAAISVVWPAGSYLTFQTNATNTAMCTFGADYIVS